MIIERNTKNYWKYDWNIICTNLINGDKWWLLLVNQPQFSEYCDWSKLTGYHWCWLLSEQPQFAKYCDWNKLTDNNWDYLLSYEPELEEYRK